MPPETFPCPRQDGGICTIPPKTLLFRGSDILIRSRTEIERDYPNLDLTIADTVPVDLPVGHSDLLAAASATGDEPDDEPEGDLMTLTPASIRSELLRIFATSPAAETVIVECSCGDSYMKPL